MNKLQKQSIRQLHKVTFEKVTDEDLVQKPPSRADMKDEISRLSVLLMHVYAITLLENRPIPQLREWLNTKPSQQRINEVRVLINAQLKRMREFQQKNTQIAELYKIFFQQLNAMLLMIDRASNSDD